MTGLSEKTVILGVCGGIAAYKAATVASLLVQAGARVDVVLTEGSLRFIQPLTFAAITHRAVHSDLFESWREDVSGHVSLAGRADLLIVAPATAASIARMALGLSDDLLGLIALSTEAPILIAPAMEGHMYRHPATQQHLRMLADRGAIIIGPEEGRLASGATGVGRMSEPADIVRRAAETLDRCDLLAGSHVVVTAAGTREALDPVRFLGNRSSGRMGFAIAEAALAFGARVTLITGPTALSPPVGAALLRVESAREMLTAVEQEVAGADILIMAAAVADYRPEVRHSAKMKKVNGQDHIDLRLVRNPDILANVQSPGLVKIGFAAETENLVENAAAKLQAKKLAMIVANDAETTIDAEDSTAIFLMADGTVRPLPRLSKQQLAVEIVRTAGELARQSFRQDP